MDLNAVSGTPPPPVPKLCDRISVRGWNELPYMYYYCNGDQGYVPERETEKELVCAKMRRSQTTFRLWRLCAVHLMTARRRRGEDRAQARSGPGLATADDCDDGGEVSRVESQCPKHLKFESHLHTHSLHRTHGQMLGSL